MAHGLASNADDGDNHSETVLLRTAVSKLESQQRALRREKDKVERLRSKKGASKCLRCHATQEWLE